MGLKYSKGQCCKCPEGKLEYIVKKLPSGWFCNFHNKERLNQDKVIVVSKGKSKPLNKATGELVLFKSIWNTRKRVSFLSKTSLQGYESTDFWINLFAHVLSKAQNKYPKFKLYEKNIILLSPDEHYLLDHGTEEQRNKYAEENNCSWDEVYKLKEELKKEYLRI